mgnify:CR=1 FL=1
MHVIPDGKSYEDCYILVILSYWNKIATAPI